ncbi:MAG: rhomboid family intramembrane serine protease [Terrimicrobiaceae bacterium]|nr:rhomboid family intramembrane serine protease [Terrimicrobiaceae bacterium]
MFRNRPRSGDPATRVIIAANIAIFVLQLLAGRHWLPVEETFALTGYGLLHGEFWQLVTYQFLHANELHILMNMVGLWFAGRELERVVGTGRFLALYLGGGVVAGLTQVIFSASAAPLIGASGSVCAVLLALTTLFPHLPITALIFFVLPVRMRARTLGYGLVGVSILFWWSGLQPEVGHLAHLGGFATGWVFGLAYRRRFGEGGGFWGRTASPPPLPRDPAFGGLRPLPSVDEILAKVLDQGIESLTRDERRILEQARRPRRWG